MYPLYKTEFFSQNFKFVLWDALSLSFKEYLHLSDKSKVNVWIIWGLAQNKICGKDLHLRGFNYLMDFAAIGFQGFL